MTRPVSLRGLAGILFLLACAFPVFPQATASPGGRVFDPSGAAVTGARVRLDNPVTGFARETATDDKGAFSFSNVPFHSYSVHA